MSASLYFFNSGHENALLNSSPYYTYPTNVVKMQNDLAYICAWYADPDDYVLLNNQLPDNFISSICDLNLAKEVTISNLNSYIPPIDNIHLWGISPQSIHKCEELNKVLSADLEYPRWNKDLIKLSSRETAKDCLTYLQQNLPTISKDIVPIFFYNLDDIEKYVTSTNYQLLAKAPYSSSGRGLLWLPIRQLNRTEKQIIHGMLKKQDCVSVEKVLDKVVDFAMEFNISDKGKCSFTAYSLFYTNKKGNYSHNYIGSQQNIIELLSQYVSIQDLSTISDLLIKYIEEYFTGIYSGCVGVDMMIYKEFDNYHIHPCLEINVRDNMGLIAYSLATNHISHDSEGYFYIDYKDQKGKQMEEEERMKRLHPISIENNKIKSGYLSLCPILPETKYRAYILLITTKN